MSGLNRFSSRLQPLYHVFLSGKLKSAKSYKRIAGYFRSSIFELVGEEIANIPNVQILCNSDLDIGDLKVAKAAEAQLKARWNECDPDVESLLRKDRYKKLYDLLISGNVEIRIVPKDRLFLHGKAGVIEDLNGSKTSFLGSINETKSAFHQNYEILWEDPSPEGVAWVEEEFEYFWDKESWPLPNAIVDEIKRIADRIVVPMSDLKESDIPAASLVESPIYRGGEQLQPWQRSFVTFFMDHRNTYGKARLLLADEVGLGKTLSLAISGMMSVLLGDGPTLILCPATLTYQWQAELLDHLGIPSAVWHSNRKEWVDPHGHRIKTQGPEGIRDSPYQIAIVSTGLIVHQSRESEILSDLKFGTVILDEAHKARSRGGLGDQAGQPNNLLEFMKKIGYRTKNILLGTATPIQTDVADLWDMLEILNSGCDFVLGREIVSLWSKGELEKALRIIKGLQPPSDEQSAWELLRNPLAPNSEDNWFQDLRSNLGLTEKDFFVNKPLSDLKYLDQEWVRSKLSGDYFHRHNPIIRHTVLRRRDNLENVGMLEKINVRIHPDTNQYSYDIDFIGEEFRIGLLTNTSFDLAYRGAQGYSSALRKRVKGAGFMESLLLQRICSSFAAGKKTAEKMLRKDLTEDLDEDESSFKETIGMMTPEEIRFLEQIIAELSRPEARDPKLKAVFYFLTEHQIDRKTWLEHGCIIFSQYYDTVFWAANELAKLLPNEPIALYAGFGKSKLYRDGQWGEVDREIIKALVKNKEIRLVLATDAACEGLNLQTLGTLINIDLPWNPARLEQRLGRIKRFGQSRETVDMLNLMYHATRDEDIYQVVSRRLKEKFDIFGGIPDTIEDEWITSVEEMEKMMDKYIHLRKENINMFDDKYQKTIAPDQNRWDLCSRVLSRKNVLSILSNPWQ